MEKLLEIGDKAISHAQKLGADEAETFLYMQNLTTIKFMSGIFTSRGGVVKGIKGSLVRIAEPWIKKKGLPMITSGVKVGVGIRAIIKKSIGFASVSSTEEKKVLNAVEEAVKIAKIRPPDPNWVSLSEPKRPLIEGGIFDERVSNRDIEEMLNVCADCCRAAGDVDKRITQAMGMVAAASIHFGIVNTAGIEAYDRGTVFIAFVGTKGKSGVEEVTSGDELFSRTYSKDLQDFGVGASKRTIECFGRKTLREKYVGPVLFENRAWSEFFSAVFAYGISGFNVQENRSVYKGKIGKQVAGENISIVDNGILSEGFGTSKIDDEGVPRQKTPIIVKGILGNFLYDNYSAKREKLDSTGNASRQRLFGATAYANQPAVRPSNLELMPGKGSLEEIVEEVKNGVLVKGSVIGAGHSNVITGDFSVTAENAFKIENGAISYPLKACTIAGNLYEALNSVVMIGNDSKCFANVICPSIAIEKIVVSM